MKRLMELSGEKLTWLPSITQSSEGWSLTNSPELRTLLERNQVIEGTAAEGRAMCFLPFDDGNAGHPFFIDCPHYHRREQFELLQAQPWPQPTAETFVPSEFTRGGRIPYEYLRKKEEE